MLEPLGRSEISHGSHYDAVLRAARGLRHSPPTSRRGPAFARFPCQRISFRTATVHLEKLPGASDTQTWTEDEDHRHTHGKLTPPNRRPRRPARVGQKLDEKPSYPRPDLLLDNNADFVSSRIEISQCSRPSPTGSTTSNEAITVETSAAHSEGSTLP